MNIVLSRLDRLGDLILSTPTIRTLRRTYPQAKLSLVCSRYNHEAVKHNTDIDELYIAESGESPRAIGKQFRHADLAVALAPRSDDLRLIAATNASQRIGYTYVRRLGTRLLARLTMTTSLISGADPELCDREPDRPIRHEVEQLLELARAAGAQTLLPDIVLPVSAADRAAAAHLPEGSITIHLAPRWLSEGSTEASFSELLSELRQLGRPLVITHAAETAAVAQRVRHLVDAVAGSLSFGGWVATFERAACVLTVDTGATHVASAMKRPTVVLFEHRHFHLNSREWAPWNVPAHVARKPDNDSEAALAASRKELVAAVGRLIAA